MHRAFIVVPQRRKRPGRQRQLHNQVTSLCREAGCSVGATLPDPNYLLSDNMVGLLHHVAALVEHLDAWNWAN